ncbi:hypothetical protein A2165_01500 [Candidatus Curtissbacteria bacterium RBG_13_40_7]|uniref:Uncharacterized protein n=1 Tax=Candidatus Curtissbacteria bacterium RBG_13_40_7 TaxID=1797706 RepID=A0A1F5FW73_9BACT|nr:MAG: hypothetical protein A2165_01500 [Candidatus Curtissbacteria bacterium RBG_13_40_7]
MSEEDVDLKTVAERESRNEKSQVNADDPKVSVVNENKPKDLKELVKVLGAVESSGLGRQGTAVNENGDNSVRQGSQSSHIENTATTVSEVSGNKLERFKKLLSVLRGKKHKEKTNRETVSGQEEYIPSHAIDPTISEPSDLGKFDFSKGPDYAIDDAMDIGKVFVPDGCDVKRGDVPSIASVRVGEGLTLILRRSGADIYFDLDGKGKSLAEIRRARDFVSKILKVNPTAHLIGEMANPKLREFLLRLGFVPYKGVQTRHPLIHLPQGGNIPDLQTVREAFRGKAR